jgi:uncharacterized membrane protein (UPF0127 family)
VPRSRSQRELTLVAVHVAESGQALATRVQVARSLWSRFRGLMGRRGLDEGAGLWLRGDSSIHMCFMLFPIDAVFLAPTDAGESGRDWRVVAIRSRLPPWRGLVLPVRGANGCLEIAAGAADMAQLRVGDRVRFEDAAP